MSPISSQPIWLDSFFLLTTHFLLSQHPRVDNRKGKMPLKLLQPHLHRSLLFTAKPLSTAHHHLPSSLLPSPAAAWKLKNRPTRLRNPRQRSWAPAISASSAPLDLTEENIKQVLADARIEASLLSICANEFAAKPCNSNGFGL